MSELQLYCTVVFLRVKFQYLKLLWINICDFFTLDSSKKASLPHKKITNLSRMIPEILAAQGSKVQFPVPPFGQKWRITDWVLLIWILIVRDIYSRQYIHLGYEVDWFFHHSSYCILFWISDVLSILNLVSHEI